MSLILRVECLVLTYNVTLWSHSQLTHCWKDVCPQQNQEQFSIEVMFLLIVSSCRDSETTIYIEDKGVFLSSIQKLNHAVSQMLSNLHHLLPLKIFCMTFWMVNQAEKMLAFHCGTDFHGFSMIRKLNHADKDYYNYISSIQWPSTINTT